MATETRRCPRPSAHPSPSYPSCTQQGRRLARHETGLSILTSISRSNAEQLAIESRENVRCMEWSESEEATAGRIDNRKVILWRPRVSQSKRHPRRSHWSDTKQSDLAVVAAALKSQLWRLNFSCVLNSLRLSRQK